MSDSKASSNYTANQVTYAQGDSSTSSYTYSMDRYLSITPSDPWTPYSTRAGTGTSTTASNPSGDALQREIDEMLAQARQFRRSKGKSKSKK